MSRKSALLLPFLLAGGCTAATDPYERRARAAEVLHAAPIVEEDHLEAMESPSLAQALRRDRDADVAYAVAAADEDLLIAAAIREAILASPTLSFEGKNITIVSEDGAVTLKGVVMHDEEREDIEELVHKIEGVRSVENELVVDMVDVR